MGQQPKSKDGVVYTKMEDENNKGRIRVTIESPNFNNLRNDLPSGDKSALNATDNTSRGHLQGIGSRDDSKFQILTLMVANLDATNPHSGRMTSRAQVADSLRQS